MEQDRTYWRAQDDKRLIDEAKYYPSVELCIALAKRLQDTNSYGLAGQLETAREDLYCAKRTIENLTETIAVLEAQIDGLIYGDNDND